MSNNPIKYTSTDFDSVIADINADPTLRDSPEFWKRIWAGVMDVVGLYLNANANQSHLRTSFTRQAAIDHCALVDYQTLAQATSSGELIFMLDASVVTFPVTFAAADLKAQSQGTIQVSAKKFEARAGKTVAAVTETFTVVAATDLLTVARVYTTGERIRFTTATTLPAPLQLNTDYYAIYVSDTTIKVADSVQHAFQGTAIDITDTGTGIHTIHIYCFKQTVYQQETKDQTRIGASDGITPWQIFRLPDKLVLVDTLIVTINSQVWTRVDTFVNSLPSSHHFKLIYLDNGDSEIIFGDGVYGEIPGIFDINVVYAVGGGFSSNINIYNMVNSYAGANTNINGATNAVYFSGGAEEETIENAKNLAPMKTQAQDRFVTDEDGKYLAEHYAGVLQVGMIPNYSGVLSVKVMLVPAGGGAPSGGLITALQTYLLSKTVLKSMFVLVSAPSYVSAVPILQIKVLSGFIFATVQNYAVLALRLQYTEVIKEILALYETSVDSVIAYINAKWFFIFNVSDDGSVVKKILDNLAPGDFGRAPRSYEVLDLLKKTVPGIDYVTDTGGTTVIALADSTEICTDAVVPANITQIP